MAKRSVAVILPVYRGDNPQYVSLALDSLVQQTCLCRVFVGVDGLIPETIDHILTTYAAQWAEVAIVRFTENRGLACVLNDLLVRCFQDGYEYIARMDADDISMPDRIAKQMAFLAHNPDVDVVGGAIEEIDAENNPRGKIVSYPATPAACRAFFARRNPLAHPAVLFRKRFFDKVGGLYRSEYRQNQDTMLWYDGLMAGANFANIPDVVLKFRMTDVLFRKRRNGWSFARKQLQDRLMINRNLHYGVAADIFAYAMFVLLVSPAWLKKIAYRLFR